MLYHQQLRGTPWPGLRHHESWPSFTTRMTWSLNRIKLPKLTQVFKPWSLLTVVNVNGWWTGRKPDPILVSVGVAFGKWASGTKWPERGLRGNHTADGERACIHRERLLAVPLLQSTCGRTISPAPSSLTACLNQRGYPVLNCDSPKPISPWKKPSSFLSSSSRVFLLNKKVY